MAVSENGRFDEEARLIYLRATHDESGAFSLTRLDVAEDLVELTLRDDRSLSEVAVSPITHLVLADCCSKTGDKLVVDALFDDQASGRSAHLPGVYH